MATPHTTSTQHDPGSSRGRGPAGTILASRPLSSWRTVDILTIAFLGAAIGVAFWVWGIVYNGPLTALKIGYAPLMGLFVGTWFLAGVVGGLVVRRPGAALFCEVVAALVSMIPGTEWGVGVLIAGILQGLGAEAVFAMVRYRRFSIAVAVLAGVLAAPLEWLYEVMSFPASWADVPGLGALAGSGGWYAEWDLGDKLVYLGTMSISGAVLAGVVGWLLTRSLSRVGALDAFPPGQEFRQTRAV